MAVHWRVTETYIKCICDSITMGTNFVNVFKYHPVIGSGYIELNGNTDWGDDVIPIEYDRFKTRVELLKDLGYSVMFIATKFGTTEEEVRKIVGKDYVHKDYSEMRSEYFMLLNANSHLRNEVHAKNDEIETLEGNYKTLRAKYDAISGINDCIGEESKKLIEENAKLNAALESEMADNLQFEQRGKELIEENARLSAAINDLKERYLTLRAKYAGAVGANACGEDERKKLIEENARLSAALKSEEEANDILTNEIDDLKRQYEMLQAKHDTLSGVNACWNEENEKLTKQISDLRSAYDRIYRSRDEHIKHNEALERKVKELTTENEEQRTVIRSLTEYKDSWREEALRYKEELATSKAKYAEATREKNCLRTAVDTWRAKAFDYKKRYNVAKSANTSMSNRYEKLAAENEDCCDRNVTLRTQRDMAIRLLFTTHDYDEIADALHIPESLIREIIEEDK